MTVCCLNVTKQSVLLALALATYQQSLQSKSTFFIWTCAILGIFGGNFALYPTASVRLFGPHHAGSNYSLVLVGKQSDTLREQLCVRDLVQMLILVDICTKHLLP